MKKQKPLYKKHYKDDEWKFTKKSIKKEDRRLSKQDLKAVR